MSGRLVASAVSSALAGAALAFGTFGVLDAGGPAEREEATVETRGQHDSSSTGHQYDLVLRTASGERFEVSSADASLDLEPGSPVRLEVSEVGHSAQAVETAGHRVETGNSPVGLGIVAVVIAAMALLFTLICAGGADRPAPAALTATAGFLAGALPVLLLF
ncbi:hypothetical protein SAMN05421837_105794 [Amycolatopsis pretoriensis]|uniref:Uncharacterized protein n=1 Tax=Amycolatopsis pretoriensis TaxID=218821 RepID=A0A1H5QZI9_9PSEU|nr:hypothetical protein [Amycolatopsis pretoriensis]SEF31562.1 hypothetical protein SAMN05421837_105794 [Amycolatopsis pretoriensis]